MQNVPDMYMIFLDRIEKGKFFFASQKHDDVNFSLHKELLN